MRISWPIEGHKKAYLAAFIHLVTTVIFHCHSAEPPPLISPGAIFHADEFSLQSAEGNTVQVRKKEDFPREIRTSQRIAVFLDSISPDRQLLLETAFICASKDLKAGKPSIEIVFNKKVLYKNQLTQGRSPASVFIPSSHIENHGNVLQIRNIGMEEFEFNHIKLDYFRFPGTDPKQAAKISNGISEFSRMLSDSCDISASYQEKLLKFIPYELSNCLNRGDSIHPIPGVKHPGMEGRLPIPKNGSGSSTCPTANSIISTVLNDRNFFDPVTKAPYLPYYALRAASKLFEGEPAIIPSNLILSNTDKALFSTAWTAVRNSEGVITAQISTLHEDGEEAHLLLPVPWSGKTKCRMITGFIPPELASLYPSCEKLSVEEKTVEILDGVFETDIKLSHCSTVRLIRDGAKEPLEISSFDFKNKPIRTVFQRGILKTDAKRHELSAPIRMNLRPPGKATSVLSANYTTVKKEATKGDIDGIKGIIPYDKKSDFVEISYPDGKPCPYEGANLFFSRVPENYREFSFWIYPRTEAPPPSASKFSAKQALPPKKVTLQFYFENENGYQFLAADLKPDEWQRVVLPSDKVKLPQSGRICIVGDPKLPEYAKGNKVSFEFNGFCTVGDEHPEKGKFGLKNARIAGAQKEKTFILSGEPGKYFEYRYQFKEPVDISKVSELSGYEGLKYVYKKGAQILEISGKFPSLDNPEADAEKAGKKTDASSNFVLFDEARKLLTPEEVKRYEAGELAILATKASLRD